mmetsp:Transcript_12783/g.21615  ORF Transcript_12783/g.21615 Transcript_12783/m.21615 type:complete len:176 (+) Transcript_12783:344-871(+)
MINYNFCVSNQFSNEKISSLLAIMDFLLHVMIKRQLQMELGLKLLKQILAKHSLQRPPYSIFIFSEAESQRIVDFMLNSFFRHYSLYEYSFKPKVELVLMTLPKDEARRTSVNDSVVRSSGQAQLKDSAFVQGTRTDDGSALDPRRLQQISRSDVPLNRTPGQATALEGSKDNVS